MNTETADLITTLMSNTRELAGMHRKVLEMIKIQTRTISGLQARVKALEDSGEAWKG